MVNMIDWTLKGREKEEAGRETNDCVSSTHTTLPGVTGPFDPLIL
jgi:hypothetical protein